MLTRNRSLDLSFNNIGKRQTLPSLAKLQVLYSCKTRFPAWKRGELDGRQTRSRASSSAGTGSVRSINLDKLTKLEELWLGRTRSARWRWASKDAPVPRLTGQNLGTFSCLRILSIQSNRLTKIVAWKAWSTSRELYLSHNGLKKLEGLEKNVSVRERGWARADSR